MCVSRAKDNTHTSSPTPRRGSLLYHNVLFVYFFFFSPYILTRHRRASLVWGGCFGLCLGGGWFSLVYLTALAVILPRSNDRFSGGFSRNLSFALIIILMMNFRSNFLKDHSLLQKYTSKGIKIHSVILSLLGKSHLTKKKSSLGFTNLKQNWFWCWLTIQFEQVSVNK